MNSEIKFETSKGYLVLYKSDFTPFGVVELNIIPEIFEVFIIQHYPKLHGLSNYRIQWKRTLSFDERLFCNCTRFSRNIMDRIHYAYENYQKKIERIGFKEFSKEYQRFTPEQIQEARKYCILDSDGVPTAPVVPVVAAAESSPAEQAAALADSIPSVKWEFAEIQGYVVFYESDFNQGGSPKKVIHLKTTLEMFVMFVIKNPYEIPFSSNTIRLKESLSLEEKFIAPEFSQSFFRTVEKWPEYEDFRKRINSIGLDVFTKEYQRFTPEQIQEARKYCILDSDGVPAAPVPVVAAADPAPEVVPPVAADSVPSGFVPAVIQGTFAEIQGSVRDSKRETTLTENKKGSSDKCVPTPFNPQDF